MTNTCPHCGRAIVIELQKHNSAYGVPFTPLRPMADSARRPRFGDVAQAQVQAEPELQEATRDTPARPPSKEADFWVPLLNATVAGLLFGSSIGLIVAKITPNVRFGDDIQWTGIIIVATIGGSWLIFLARSNSTLWIREKIVNRDLDGDRQIGKPDHVEFTIKREDKDIEGDSWERGKMPCPNGQLQYLEDFCQAIIEGYATFSERGSREDSKDPKKGAAHFGYNTRLWDKLRDGFVDRGWAYWRGEGRQGVAFTDIGEQVIREIAEGSFVP